MEAKPIFNSYMAKRLLLAGNNLVNLQPDKEKENATIFYFELTDKLLKDLTRFSKEK